LRGGGSLPAARQLAEHGGKLRSLPETTLAEIDAKAKQFQVLRAWPDWLNWKTACDAYVAAFVAPKRGGVPGNKNTVTIPTTAHVWEAMAGRSIYGPLVARVDALAQAARAFHWPLEFPDVVARGGFDVVLGNPPWERIKLQEQEFFAVRSPEIATAPNKAARERLIRALDSAPQGSPEQVLFEAFQTAKRIAEATSEFSRVPEEDGGRFPLTGRGDVNTYALFAELFAHLARPMGRAGVVVPTGIATDGTTAPFFSALVRDRRIFSLYDFQTGLGFFDRIGHARFKFCLLTVGAPQTAPDNIAFSFFSRTIDEHNDPLRRFTLSASEIERLNPNTRTAPVFRTKHDADLTAKIYSTAPVLIDDGKGVTGNPWGVNFLAMFHMSADSNLFRTAAQLARSGFQRTGTDWVSIGVRPRQGTLAIDGASSGSLDLASASSRAAQHYVPLYEAKMIHQFDHRWAGYADNGEDTADISLAQKQDPAFEPAPRYWVPEAEVEARLSAKRWRRGWLMGWRDIARATDERTMISGIIPRVACGDKYLLAMPDQNERMTVAFFSNMNALVADFVVRQKLGGTSFKYFTMRQVAFLPPSSYTEPRLAFIVPRALELTYTSHSLAPFARDVGYNAAPFIWNEDRRAHLRAELDAFYARAYGLTRDELRYILDPADVKGPDYPSETFRVLKEKETRRYGEYRTARLVLQAWDRMETDGSFKRMDL
jgi:hypothetical protein